MKKLKRKLKSTLALFLCVLMVANFFGSPNVSAAEILQLDTNVTISDSGALVVNWTSISEAEKYSLLLYEVGAKYCYAYERNLTTTTYTSKADLPANKQYNVVIVAYNSSGVSIVSETKKTLIPSDFYESVPPAAPRNISATATANSVKIKWSAVTGAKSYDVVFNGTTYNVIGTSKEFTGLSPKTSYTYYISANNTSGKSEYSATKTITTRAASPFVPTNVTATATKDSVTVSWNAVTGATGYNVIFNGITYSMTDTSQTFTGLLAGTYYSYCVCAKDADTSSSYSAVGTITTIPNPPTVPANVAARATSDSVRVSWSAVKGATKYNILFDGTTYTVTGTSEYFTGLSPKTNYTYSVRAVNAGGESSDSSVQTIETLPAPLAQPGNITATSTSTSITISWSAVTGATSYGFWYQKESKTNIGKEQYTTDTSITITGLSPNTNYQYAVFAKNDDTQSLWPQGSIKTVSDQ